jgi:hypothetical protein
MTIAWTQGTLRLGWLNLRSKSWAKIWREQSSQRHNMIQKQAWPTHYRQPGGWASGSIERRLLVEDVERRTDEAHKFRSSDNV